MTKVYLWPATLGASHLYTPPHRVRTTLQWDGAPGQKVATTQRSAVTIGGNVAGPRGGDLDVILDQIAGGENLVALWDTTMRKQNGWDDAVAGVGDDEVWRADGQTSLWAGETPGGSWRSVLLSGSGSADSTSLTVSGILTGETIPKGTWVRVGDYRYRVAADASESGGSVALTLSRPLIEAPSGSNIRLPGDFMVGSMIGQPQLGERDLNGGRSFSVTFAEVYEAEVQDGFEFQ